MNYIFVLAHIYIIEIRKSYKFVMFAILCAVIGSVSSPENNVKDFFIIWSVVAIITLISIGLVVVIRYVYARRLDAGIVSKISAAENWKSQKELARDISDKLKFKI